MFNLQTAQPIHIGNANGLSGQLLETEQIGFSGEIALPEFPQRSQAGCRHLVRRWELFSKGQGHFTVGIAKNLGELWKDLIANGG